MKPVLIALLYSLFAVFKINAQVMPCMIDGVDTMCEDETETFTVDTVGKGWVSLLWSVNANGMIIGPTGNPSVQIKANMNVSSLTITLLVTDATNATNTCTKAVDVASKSDDPTGVSVNKSLICLGDSITLTLNGGGGGTNAIVEWFQGSCGSTPIGTGNPFTFTPSSSGNITFLGRYKDIGFCTNTSICRSATVTIAAPSSDPASAIATPPLVCAGSSSTLSLQGGSIGTGAKIVWYKDACGMNKIGEGNNLSTGPLNATTIFFGRYEDPAPCNSNTICRSVTVFVNSKSVNPGSATATPPLVCAGSASLLNLQGGSLGTGAKIVWYKDACGTSKIGEGNNLSTGPLNTTTNFFGRYEDPAPCNSNTTCQSVTVVVNSKSVNPSSAIATPSLICAGSSSTLSLQGGSLGTNAKIVWYKDACGTTKVGEGNNLSTGPLNTTTTFFGRYEDPVPCNSNTICQPVTVVVNSKSVNPSSAIAIPSLICAGSSSTLSLQGGSLGTGAKIVWYKDACGTNRIGEGNNLSTGPLNATTTFFGRYEDPMPCNSNTICQPVTVEVISASNVNRVLTADQTVCKEGDPALLDGNPVTGNGTPGYQWMAASGNCSGNFSLIPGATMEDFNPPARPASTISYKREATLSLRGLTCPVVASNCVTVNLNTVEGGLIAPLTQSICPKDVPDPILSQDDGIFSGAASYRWNISNFNCNTGFIPVNGSSKNLTLPVLPNNSFLRRIAISRLNGIECMDTSNCVSILHKPAPTAVISSVNTNPSNKRFFEFFSSNSRPGGPNSTFKPGSKYWVITDGNMTLDSQYFDNIQHTFQNIGMNRVCLGLENNENCAHDTCLNITIQSDSCKDVGFKLVFNSSDSIFCEGERFTLSAIVGNRIDFSIPSGIICTLRVNFNNGRFIKDITFTSTNPINSSNFIQDIDFSSGFIRLDSLNSVSGSIQVPGRNPARIAFECFDEMRFFVFRKPRLELAVDSFCVSAHKDSTVTLNLNIQSLDPLKEFRYVDPSGNVKIETTNQLKLEPIKDSPTLIKFNLLTRNGCTDTISKSIFAFSIPNFDSIPDNILVCEGKPADINLMAKNHPGFYNYTWSYRDDAGGLVQGSGPKVNFTFNSSTKALVFNAVNLRSASLSCSARDSILFRKAPTPQYDLKEISPCTGLYYLSDRNSTTTDIKWTNLTQSNIASVDASGLIVLAKGFGSLVSALSINGNCEVLDTVKVDKLPGDQTMVSDLILRRICLNNSELLLPNIPNTASCFRWIIIDTSRLINLNGRFNYPIEIIDSATITRDSSYFNNKIVFMRAFNCNNPDSCGSIGRLAPRSTENFDDCSNKSVVRELIVYPNPTNGNLNLKLIGFPSRVSRQVFLTDFLGRQVVLKDDRSAIGTNIISMQLPESLPEGMYSISIYDENAKIFSVKFILIR